MAVAVEMTVQGARGRRAVCVQIMERAMQDCHPGAPGSSARSLLTGVEAGNRDERCGIQSSV